jgi:hypothetical protein
MSVMSQPPMDKTHENRDTAAIWHVPDDPGRPDPDSRFTFQL